MIVGRFAMPVVDRLNIRLSSYASLRSIARPVPPKYSQSAKNKVGSPAQAKLGRPYWFGDSV